MNLVFYVLFSVGAVVLIFFWAKQRGLRNGREAFYKELLELPPVVKDFSTPEGAILCLEDGYRKRDMDAVIAAKDFTTEARLMLEKAGLHEGMDEEIVKKASDTLLVNFKSHLEKKWPDFKGVKSFFLKRDPYSDKIVIVTEACRQPNGELSQQRILVSETSQGWRVLNPV
ncbi:MAG: hypothetical protein OEM02_00275 [Desulfobulbaceae bacterium]|nr:hypothetical protein [Desulfobulbaceae bacterium]